MPDGDIVSSFLPARRALYITDQYRNVIVNNEKGVKNAKWVTSECQETGDLTGSPVTTLSVFTAHHNIFNVGGIILDRIITRKRALSFKII